MAELNIDEMSMAVAKNVIEHLRNENIFLSRWIPVSERLPEEYGEYLITWTTSQGKRPFVGISEGEVTGEYDYEHNRFKVEWLLEDYIKAYSDIEVIAWMPLPEPYKADRKNFIESCKQNMARHGMSEID